MKSYKANLLFDGQDWKKNQFFQVDSQGIIIKMSGSSPEDHKAITSLGVVIPGFINCHSHSFQRAMAGLGERLSGKNIDDSFWTWRDQMYGLVQNLNPHTFKAIADWVYLEMLEAGYTSVGEFHYLHKKPDGRPYDDPCEMSHQLIQSAQEVGIRLCLLPVLYQRAGIGRDLEERQQPFGMKSLDEYLNYHEALDSLIPENFKLGAALHSIRAVDRDQLKEFSAEFNLRSSPVHIHIAEQIPEIEESLKHYQKRAVDFLLDEVTVNENWSLIHATHLSDSERKRIADSGAVVGICPLTEANLGDGIFPMKEFLGENGRIAIGSDSQIRVDPFEELRWIEYSQRYRFNSRACLTSREEPSPGNKLAKECYAGGRQSLQMNIGTLKEGFQADFVVLNENHPSLFRLNPKTLWDEMIFTGGHELVKHVYSSGKRIVYNGKHTDRDRILKSYKQSL